MRSDHRHLTAYQVGCEVGQSVGLVLRPAIFDRQILAFDITSFFQALAERAQAECVKVGGIDGKESYHRHRGRLRAYRERPCHRAAERGYQFPPSDVDWHVPLSVRGMPIERNDTTPRASGLHVREGGDAGAAPQL